MERLEYPIGSDGVPLIPGPDCEECEHCQPYNRHHLWWPRTEYMTRVERRFRNLGQFVVHVCPVAHEKAHHYFEPPVKPNREFMLDALDEASALRQ